MVTHLFVSIDDPNQGPDPGTRRAVRSHISKLQHERNRYLHCRPMPKQEKSRDHAPELPDHDSDNGKACDPPRLTEEDSAGVHEHVAANHRIQQRAADQASRNISLLALKLSAKDPTDELARLIVATGISFSSLCNFQAYMASLMGPDCDLTHSLPKGTLQCHIMKSFRHHPAARAAIMICCVGAVRQAREQSLRNACVLELRSYVIRCVQEAIDDEKTRTSDYAALAVASMGIFDRSYGFIENHDVHTQAVKTMQLARGGSMGWMLDRVLLWMGNLGNNKITHYTHTAHNDLPDKVELV